MWLLRSLVHLFLFVVCVALIVCLFLFFMSPYVPFRKMDVVREPVLTHAVDGKSVNLTFQNIPYLLKPSVQTLQLELLSNLTDFLQHAQCSFWAVKSTLLAAVRHGQLIPWDDMVCVAILHDDLHTLVHLRPEMEKTGKFLLKYHRHAYYFCANNYAQYPCVEINIMQPKDHEISVCTPLDELGGCSFQDSFLRRREICNKDAVFPLKYITFANMSLPIPNHAEECLRVAFGSDWDTMPLWDTTKLVNNGYSWALARRFL